MQRYREGMVTVLWAEKRRIWLPRKIDILAGLVTFHALGKQNLRAARIKVVTNRINSGRVPKAGPHFRLKKGIQKK